MSPKLIVMLTHHDQTIKNAIDVFNACKDSSAEYWGFKDVGFSIESMEKLVTNIKKENKTAFLEVVRYTEKECFESAKLALECGFDFLMGTIYYDSINNLLKGKAVKYMPFCGKVSQRPTILEGTIPEIINEARLISSQGVHGFDLLAYRYVGNAEKLAKEFIKSIEVPVVIAGSIASFDRLDKMKEVSPWGFTIGSAFFENKFGNISIEDQIETVIEYINKQKRL